MEVTEEEEAAAAATAEEATARRRRRWRRRWRRRRRRRRRRRWRRRRRRQTRRACGGTIGRVGRGQQEEERRVAGSVRGRTHTSMSRHRPGSRPRSPMKDTPPEGDRAKDLPRDLSRRRSRPFWAGGASNARPAARAGPTYGRRQGYSQIASQAGIAARADARACLPRAQTHELRVARLECAWRPSVNLRFGQARVPRCIRALRPAYRPVGPTLRGR